MTAQKDEVLIYKRQKVSMCAEALAQYLKSPDLDKKFSATSTACWRGYIGTWLIEMDLLYLIDIDKTQDGHLGVDFIFPGQKKVFADWFTGRIRVPQGEMLRYVHAGYGSVYEKDLFLEFKNGILISESVVENQVGPEGKRESVYLLYDEDKDNDQPKSFSKGLVEKLKNFFSKYKR